MRRRGMSGIKLGDAFTRFVVNDQALKESWAGIRFVLLSAKFFDFEIADLLGSRCPVTLNAGDLMQRLWRRYGLGMMYLAPNSLKTRAALIRPAIDILLDRHQKFFDQLRGPQPKLVAKGTTSDGLHTEIDAAQWNRSDRFIDFRNGDVWDKTEGGRMLWSGVSLAERGPAATHLVGGNGKPDKEWLCRKEAAIYLERIGYSIAPHTLANMASNGKGPPCTRLHRKAVRYKRSDLDEWAKQHSVRRQII